MEWTYAAAVSNVHVTNGPVAKGGELGQAACADYPPVAKAPVRCLCMAVAVAAVYPH